MPLSSPFFVKFEIYIVREMYGSVYLKCMQVVLRISSVLLFDSVIICVLCTIVAFSLIVTALGGWIEVD